jgi:hypothetical protein
MSVSATSYALGRLLLLLGNVSGANASVFALGNTAWASSRSDASK